MQIVLGIWFVYMVVATSGAYLKSNAKYILPYGILNSFIMLAHYLISKRYQSAAFLFCNI
jgi:hypothetical protein